LFPFFLEVVIKTSYTRNNSLRNVLFTFSLTSSAMTTIIDNPAILGSQTPPSQLASPGLTSSQAAYALLHGYTAGFRILFILNACLASVATISSIFLIKHKELLRGDEEKLRVEARQLLESTSGNASGKQGASTALPLHEEHSEPQDASDKVVDLETGNLVRLAFHFGCGLFGVRHFLPRSNTLDRVVCVTS
jgi:hypothetical protein